MPFQRGGRRAGEEERFRFGLQQGNEDCYEKISASCDEKVKCYQLFEMYAGPD